MKQIKICINGRALSGKDKISEHLIKEYGFSQLSFASGIYDIAEEYFNMKSKDRSLLIAIGQNMRQIKPTVWIDYTMDKINNEEDYVISDVRQKNEYIRCIEEGFIPVRVNSSLETRIKRCKERDGFEPSQETIDLWQSEGEVGADNFPYYEIYNDGSVEGLHKQVDELIEGIESGKITKDNFYKMQNKNS